MNQGQSARKLTRLFWSGTLLFAIVWTLVPALLIHNPLLDTIEALNWGAHYQWGYEKHPPFYPLVSHLFMALTGEAMWGSFAPSSASLILCFWAVWKIGRIYLDETRALLAVAMLPGIYYYGLPNIEFNANVIQLPLWALFTLAFYHAMTQPSALRWALCGALAGLMILSKYFSVFLLASAALVLLTTPEGRSQLRSFGPWLASIIGLLVIAPHIQWLIEHDFMSVRYGMRRTELTTAPWWGHMLFPAKFALSQLGCIAGALLLFTILYSRKRTLRRLPSLQDRFLLLMGLGPFVLLLCCSMMFNMQIRSMWGTPLWNLTGIALLHFYPTEISTARLRRFVVLWSVLFVAPLIACAFKYGVRLNDRSDFPGKALGREITEQWHKRYNSPLAVIAGNYWFAGNAAFYSPDKPSVITDLKPETALWTSLDELYTHGGVLIWQTEHEHATNPTGWSDALARSNERMLVTLPWQGHPDATPVTLNIAFIPPKAANKNP